MSGGVLILRIVTAPDMSTGETKAQVDPAISNFQTVLAPIGAWRNLAYLVEVTTLLCHVYMFSSLDQGVTVKEKPAHLICNYPLAKRWRSSKVGVCMRLANGIMTPW